MQRRTREPRLRGSVAILALSLATALVVLSPATASHLIPLANACDVIVVEVGAAEGAPGLVEADAGSTIMLTGDSVCDPTFEVDPVTGEATLLTGNGITIETNDVTLDLNGFDIVSSSDVAAAGDAAGVDVENAGVAVGGSNVMVTNLSASVSLVDNFTANFDYKANASSLVGALLADGSYNIVGGNAHGGGALAIDDSSDLTVDTVRLADLSANGDNGVDAKFSTNVTIQNSSIEGILTGIRLRSIDGATLLNNSISGCVALETLNVVGLVDVGNTLTEGVNCPAEPGAEAEAPAG